MISKVYKLQLITLYNLYRVKTVKTKFEAFVLNINMNKRLIEF